MAVRPAKRQRRSTVVDSDDEDDTSRSSHLPPRTQTANANIQRVKKPAPVAKTFRSNSKNSSATTSPNTSPQKPRKHSKQSVEVPNNKSLHSFFSKATEEQRWQRRAEIPHQESQEDVIIDDIVDDDSQSDSVLQASQNHVPKLDTEPDTKSFSSNKTTDTRSSTPIASQRFAKPKVKAVLAEKALDTSPQVTEQKPWADRFGPLGIDELAVHKKKIADVQKWLEDVLAGRSQQKVLVLKGPAGSGKSTTISLIAQQIGVEVVSWQNPAVSEGGSASAIQQFTEFLVRGGQFEALTLGSNTASGKQQQQQQPKLERRLLMVEEFPTMGRQSNVLDTFRSTLLQHVLRSTKPHQLNVQGTLTNTTQPVILVVSETLLSTSTALSDSFTAHRLLGPELSNHPLISVVEFNPVAPTFISKAIDLVIKKEARDSGRRRMPGPAVLQQLADVGDIRSAINSLEFLCARGEDSADWSGTVAARSKKTSKDGVPMTEREKNALQLINQRESTLDMFHATGKIVYNKREDPRVHDSRAEPPPKPPDHLMYLYSPKVSQVDVDALLNETGTDIQTFISTLHENYVLSCNGDELVDHFDSCAHVFSESEFLNPESHGLIRAKGNTRSYTINTQSGNSDMLRQDEISFQVATRGLLFSLPFPVSRAVPPGTRKQDAFKMFYPASLRLWKPAEEIYELVSMYANTFVNGSATLSASNKGMDGVASWKSRGLALGALYSSEEHIDETSVNNARSFMSKDNLITELLPYLTKIRTAQNEEVQGLKKITQFRGISISGDELQDEEQYNGTGNSLSTSARLQQKVEEAHNILQAQRKQITQHVSSGIQNENRNADVEIQEKLYISDDDIQDD